MVWGPPGRIADNIDATNSVLDRNPHTHTFKREAYTYFRCPACSSISVYRGSQYFVFGICRGRYCGCRMDEKNVLYKTNDTIVRYGIFDRVKAMSEGVTIHDKIETAERPHLFQPSEYYKAKHEHEDRLMKERQQHNK